MCLCLWEREHSRSPACRYNILHMLQRISGSWELRAVQMQTTETMQVRGHTWEIFLRAPLIFSQITCSFSPSHWKGASFDSFLDSPVSSSPGSSSGPAVSWAPTEASMSQGTWDINALMAFLFTLSGVSVPKWEALGSPSWRVSPSLPPPPRSPLHLEINPQTSCIKSEILVVTDIKVPSQHLRISSMSDGMIQCYWKIHFILLKEGWIISDHFVKVVRLYWSIWILIWYFILCFRQEYY